MPDNQKPEKIKSGPVQPASGGFLVPHAASFGIATGGDNAGFTIRTLMTVLDPAGEVLAQLTPPLHPVEPLPRSDGSDAGSSMVTLQPQPVDWAGLNPDGSPVTGTVRVTGSSQLLNPAGNAVGGGASAFDNDVVVDPTRG